MAICDTAKTLLPEWTQTSTVDNRPNRQLRACLDASCFENVSRPAPQPKEETGRLYLSNPNSLP
jgi:hypothetical protein